MLISALNLLGDGLWDSVLMLSRRSMFAYLMLIKA